ncbi:protoporphyrinogen/coproporphyrinogen oxidase [Cellulomonas alba]|uniref:FAD-dependent oxidoreductase n=1 Tax=Cellulomonas alba TaxID=3053467 RepID=A0ABT7SFH9_9CELL|nr:FAD-dependent oxidoreductase [Cellulomonas alba]MDM7854928.1 FAD-dependent oxidoreductase [Cellulomonas alba]
MTTTAGPTPAGTVERWDAVVVGGGVAGLVAARELGIAGLRVLVLEARDAAGGAVRAHTVAGIRLDAGAESFATRGGTVAALVDELGLAGRLAAPEPSGSWVHLPSGDGPLPRTGLLGIPSEPGADDVRRTLGAFGAWRARLDLLLPERIGARATTLGDLVRARMGRRVLDRLVRPIVGGVHAAEPDGLAIDAVAPGLSAARAASGGSLARAVVRLRSAAPAGSAVLGLDGGLHVLVDALTADLAARGGELRLRTSATSLTQDPGGQAYRVEARGRTGTSAIVTPRVVLATPAAPALAAGLAPALADVRLDDGALVTLVTLVLDEPALDGAPRGTGVLVAREARDVQAKALTHATAKWAWTARAAGAGRHVVRLSYGRADDETAPGAATGAAGGATAADATARTPRGGTGPEPGDDALVETALADASVLLGVPLDAQRVAGHAIVRWSQSLPRPSAAHRDAVASVRRAVAGLPGVAVCGAWVAGNGLASVVPDAREAARALARRNSF